MRMLLYRLENLVAMKDEDLSQIVDGQELILRLGEVYSNRIEFGKSSYIPVTEQTEKGLAKFYSILKYLVSMIMHLGIHLTIILFRQLVLMSIDLALWLLFSS